MTNTSAKITNIKGIGPAYARKLASVNIKTSDDLLEKCKTIPGRKEISEQSGLSEMLILKWINMTETRETEYSSEESPESDSTEDLEDLEDKIIALEAKLDKLSTSIETRSINVKPTENPKPVETKPAETVKPKGTLPKGFGDKPAPAESSKPQEEPPKPAKGTLPKGMKQSQTQQQAPPPQQTTSNNNDVKSRKEILEQYEKDYLQRLEQERIEQEKAYQEIIEAEEKARSQRTRGILPKGFEPKTESDPPKPSRGTLPKGF